MLKIQKAYKIMEVENGEIKNLFRGINRNRTLKKGRWYHAECKLGKDGSDSKEYLTGIHCLPSKELAEQYLNNFRVKKTRVIVPVLVKGERRKPTNKNVILADSLMIIA